MNSTGSSDWRYVGKTLALSITMLAGACLLHADDLSSAFGQAQGLVNQAHAQGVNTAAAQQQLNQARQQYAAWQAQQTRQAAQGQHLQSIDPFGDYLFHGVPIQPVDGKLVTRSWNDWGKNEFGPLQARPLTNPQDNPGNISKSPLSDPPGGGFGAGGQPMIAMAAPPPEDDGAVRIGSSGTPTLQRQQDPNAGKSEYSGVQQAVAEGQYAHKSAEELNALAAQYPDNPEIQQSIQKLKARNQSRDNLGALADQVSATHEAANDAMQQGNHDAIQAGAVAVGMAGVPGAEKMAEHLQGEASGAQVVGDVGKDIVTDQGKDLVVDAAKALGYNVPVVKAVLAVPDAIKLGTAGNRAINNYTDASGLNAQVQAAGGTANAFGIWNDARNQSLDDSAQLYLQIQQQNVRYPIAAPPP